MNLETFRGSFGHFSRHLTVPGKQTHANDLHKWCRDISHVQSSTSEPDGMFDRRRNLQPISKMALYRSAWTILPTLYIFTSVWPVERQPECSLSSTAYPKSDSKKKPLKILKGKYGKERYIICRLTGKFFMLIVAKLPSTLILYLWAVLVRQLDSFVWVRRVCHGSANPMSRQMWGVFRHMISQCKRWTSSRNSQTNCCCLW